MQAYGDDLAYIHHLAFGCLAGHAANFLLETMKNRGIANGTVVELGCGSGISARRLVDAGHSVFGIDIAPAMIEAARKHVPEADFAAGSFRDIPLPPCDAVIAVGECFNYTFDMDSAPETIADLFRRVHAALRPGGFFLFDTAGPERGQGFLSGHWQGEDWALLLDLERDPANERLTRRITTFRKRGELYRRTREVHHLRLFDRVAVEQMLADAGFQAQAMSSYGACKLPEGLTAFLARVMGK